MLWAWRDATPRQAALFGFLFGLAYFGIVLEWSRYFGAVAIVPLVAGEAAFVAATGALVAALARRGWRGPWVVAAVWVVLEGLRARVPFGGLAWGEVGVAMHDLAPARALAAIGGVPLVSFAVVALNALLLDLVGALRSRTRDAVRGAAIGVVSVLLVVTVADVARFHGTVTGRVHFALLQGNDQNRRLTEREFNSDFLMRHHLALAKQLRGRFDLIVFPESSLEHAPTIHPYVRTRLVAVARAHHAVVLANARTRAPTGTLYNANLAYDPDGHLQGEYDKQHLVPFGEYVPLRGLLSFIGELNQVPYDYEPGHRRVLFRVGGHKIGTVICFESAFGPLVRGFVSDGAELLVVSTNNRSYRRSGLAAQHVALSQMRAAETARPVLHASISGISGVIDADGDVRDTSELFVNTITQGVVATRTGETLFVRLGDWVLTASALFVLVAAGLGAWRSRRRSAVDSPARQPTTPRS